jgi:hypothetical protein
VVPKTILLCTPMNDESWLHLGRHSPSRFGVGSTVEREALMLIPPNCGPAMWQKRGGWQRWRLRGGARGSSALRVKLRGGARGSSALGVELRGGARGSSALGVKLRGGARGSSALSVGSSALGVKLRGGARGSSALGVNLGEVLEAAPPSVWSCGEVLEAAPPAEPS